MIFKDQTTVWHGGGRRWFTLKAACRAEARHMYRRKYPCECEPMTGYYCGAHDDDTVTRLARMLVRKTRKEQM